MSITGFLRGYRTRIVLSYYRYRAQRSASAPRVKRNDWDLSLSDPTAFYHECFRYFHGVMPKEFCEHRTYFRTGQGHPRGFGEDAFHALWYLLLEEFRPRNFLEIGIFRGQIISLVALWSRLAGQQCEVYGISPFTSAGDSVSKYPELDYYADTLANFDHFGLQHPRLLRAYSTDASALELISSKQWEMIYIDGNHEYEVVRKDWEACSRNLAPGGIVVLDDSGLSTNFVPPIFATKGHPGPSRIAQQIDRKQFREILQVGHNRAFQRLA